MFDAGNAAPAVSRWSARLHPMSPRWFRRILSLCPTAIAVLWIAGIAHFRSYDLTSGEWAIVIAGAVGLAAIERNLRRGRPPPRLPPDSNPATVAALAAAIVGVMALVVGGVGETLAETMVPSETPWALRTTWHAACAFGSSYCLLLHRLGQNPPATGAGPRPQ